MLPCSCQTSACMAVFVQAPQVVDNLHRFETARPIEVQLNGVMPNPDEAFFEESVNAQYEPLYRFAYSLTQREAEARDLTQQTFEQFARKLGSIRDKAKAKSWLFTTLYRLFVDDTRRRRRHPELDLESAEPELPVSQPDAGEHLDAASVRAALLQVKEEFRAPLVLFYLDQHSYREIAELLNIEMGTVMSRLSRGRALLRQILEDAAPAIHELAIAKTTTKP